MSGVGPAAVGYYKDGDKRWRDVAVVRADAEGAKEVFRAFKLKPGSLPVKGVGDEAVQVVVQEAPDRAKAEYIVARRGTLVAAVGDEELVLDPATPSDKQAHPQADAGREDREARRVARRHEVAASEPPRGAGPGAVRPRTRRASRFPARESGTRSGLRVKQSSGRPRRSRARRVASMKRVVTGSW